ncbi:MAG: O-antigen ligase family protein [Nonomuraea sp.]|nr:O-antigen ligase family protein [Nonomuraea sp.]NUP66841.1 O-antigen ligase family protein [Nonomuraea sp.]NUP76480.1 O-antigen ligase family protein [Nonomuraea sp.]NUS09348.1 O-antigen ligase family protein [Nonomuraea sp.]
MTTTVLPRRADGATLVCLFVLSLLILPARLAVAGLPLSLTPAEILALVLGVVWICAQMVSTAGVAKGGNPVRTSIFVYGVLLLAIYGYTTHLYLPSDELNLADHTFVLYLGYVSLLLAVCDGIGSRERLDFVLKAVVIGGTFAAIVALMQFRLDFDLTEYMRIPGLRHSSVEEVPTVISRSDLRRVAGTLGHPIEFGALSAMLLPLAAHLGFQARSRGQAATRWWICAVIIAAGLMFSVSRTAVLGLAGAGLILLLGWSNRRRIVTIGAFLVFLGFMKVLAPGLIGTFYNLFAGAGEDSSIIYRTHDYPFAMREFSKSPVFGRGLGTWYPFKHQVFDNQYLLSLVETGLLGVLGFVGVIVCGIVVALRVRRISTDPNVRNLGLTIAACLVIPLLGAATFDLLSFPGITSVLFLLVGAAGALLRFERRDQADRALLSSFQEPADRSRSLIALTGNGQGRARSGSS